MTSPNNQQQALIDSTQGLHVVDAGAGTGKTFTVTRRYAEIVAQPDIEPEDVLLVTFTNNAANEMTDRILAHYDYRMRELADASSKKYVICDFVAPLQAMRDNFDADYTIWIDTIAEGRFEDTNRAFVKPTHYDLRVTEQRAEEWIPVVVDMLQDQKFDSQRPTTQMLGRWQPWHDGHTALFKKALLETGQVCIMIRDVGGIVGSDAGAGRTAAQNDNPFDYDTVVENIKIGLAKEGFKYGCEYIIMQVPNIVDISYGRGVGYTFTQHDLGEEIHQISATKIRAQLRSDGKLL